MVQDHLRALDSDVTVQKMLLP